jgi:hypothetical protein
MQPQIPTFEQKVSSATIWRVFSPEDSVIVHLQKQSGWEVFEAEGGVSSTVHRKSLPNESTKYQGWFRMVNVSSEPKTNERKSYGEKSKYSDALGPRLLCGSVYLRSHSGSSPRPGAV